MLRNTLALLVGLTLLGACGDSGGPAAEPDAEAPIDVPSASSDADATADPDPDPGPSGDDATDDPPEDVGPDDPDGAGDDPVEDADDDPDDADDDPVEDADDDPDDADDDPDDIVDDTSDDDVTDDAGSDALPDVTDDAMPDDVTDDTGPDATPDDATDDDVTDDADEGDPPWWELAESSPTNCDDLPDPPIDQGTKPGFGGSEDFAFDATGGIVLRQGDHVVRKDFDGHGQILIPNVGFTTGIGVLPNGNAVVALEDSLLIAYATGGYQTVLSGLSYPNGLDVDHENFAYIAEQSGGQIRRVDTNTGAFEVIAAGLDEPNGVSFGPGYDRLYVGSFGSGVVYAIDRLEDGSWSDPWIFAQMYANPYELPVAPDVEPLPTGYAPCDGVADGEACLTDTGWAGTCQAGACEQDEDAELPILAACVDAESGTACELTMHGVTLPGTCWSGADAAVCCEAKEDTGCPSPPCESCVCGFDAFCCDTQWDFLCAETAKGDSCAGPCGCDAPPDVGDEPACVVDADILGYCDGKEPGDPCNFVTTDGDLFGGTCLDLSLIPLFTYPASGLGCVLPEDIGTWIEPPPLDYEPCDGVDEGGACISVAGQAGLCDADGLCDVNPHEDSANVAACVGLAPDDPCAIQIWGVDFPGICVGLGGGECCAAQETPGCPDPVCEACVCDADAFCCDNSWDDICAGEAAELCPTQCKCSGGGGGDGDATAELSCAAGPDPLAFCEGKELWDTCTFIQGADSVVGGYCLEVGPVALSDPYPESGLACVPPSKLENLGGSGTLLDGVQADECGNVYVTNVQGEIYRIDSEGKPTLLATAPVSWIPNLEFGRGIGGWGDKTLYVMTFGADEGLVTLETEARGKEWTLPELLTGP